MMQGCSNKYLDLQVNNSSYPLALSLSTNFSPSQNLLNCKIIDQGWIYFHESSFNERDGDIFTQGFTFQTCLKNPISYIRNPKTSRVELN
ncbi:hypothetical protein IGI04_026199 [Brassica rapa subsp. trilocularis]|uniref:MATH domain-containing protein n=1 Tax=Brassica rapa subsp. trilocularis TaxID=1813537 RepID=A0ABQ7KWK2_BRACM|nr:hypothetical protein IGI04_026199 [Brassica rapa subsp. trilocularis]